MRNFSPGAALILIAAVFAGCAPRADLEVLQNNQFHLRDMIAADRQQLGSLDQRTRRLQDQIDELKHGGTASESTEKRLATLDDRLGKIEAAVNALQASAPPPTTGSGAPGPAAGAPAAGGAPAVSGAGAMAPAPAPPVWQADLDAESDAAKGISGPGVKIYREGLNLMKDGKYQGAVTKFAFLQKKYPKSELSEPAEYFSANALYESGKYDQSILQFNDLVMRFPRGRFASAALLRQAQAFVRLNDKIDARLTLQKLLSDHRDAPEATAANQMMKELEN